MRATVLAVADELTEDGLVLRYRPDEADDGVSTGEEGSFTICSFWLVSALARIGETRARPGTVRPAAGFASPLGLYAEEIEPGSGRHLGNTPQAFSHLALIGAALDLDTAPSARGRPQADAGPSAADAGPANLRPLRTLPCRGCVSLGS